MRARALWLLVLGCLGVAMIGVALWMGPGAGSAVPPRRSALGDRWIRPADGMVMVYVPAGEFEMGSTDSDVDAALALCNQYCGNRQRDALDDEQPVHVVSLGAFWIDRTEVTNEQFRECVELGVCEAPPSCGWGKPTFGDSSKSGHPVVCVDWHNATAYCEWAGARLPTEAEWEYAARGPRALAFPWGSQFDGSRLNYCDVRCTYDVKDERYDDGFPQTAPVGSYPTGASWCGAVDMAGNVWEWGQDWYDWRYYRVSPSTNPEGPSSGEVRIVRGGSWFNVPLVVRSARRDWKAPNDTRLNLGIRCARGA